MKRFSAVVGVTLFALLSIGAAKPKYIQPQDLDWASILSAPPADDSAEHQAEIATVEHWQTKRTADDIARCKLEADGDVFVFADVLGDWFNRRSLPVTANLLTQAGVDAKACSTAAKDKWKRVRPFKADPTIKPCVALEDSASYPSGHAVRGVVWATILSEMFPEHKDQLMARGRQFGDDRVIAGVHWPSDVEAGQKLGGEIVQKLLENPEFKGEMERAKEECMPVAH